MPAVADAEASSEEFVNDGFFTTTADAPLTSSTTLARPDGEDALRIHVRPFFRRDTADSIDVFSVQLAAAGAAPRTQVFLRVLLILVTGWG